MKTIVPRNGKDGLCWRCSHSCRKRVSPRNGSFFEDSNLLIETIIGVLYYWVYERAAYKTLHHEFGISSHTVTDWKNSCHDVCATHFVANHVAICGPGITVEIYESLSSHCTMGVRQG